MRLLADVFTFLLFSRQALILERLRVEAGPRRAVQFARQLGERRRLRSAAARKALRRVIGVVDRWWPSGPNCYRRVLLEVGMDRGAAAELVQLGFQGTGEPCSGHAWLGTGSASDDGRSYEAIVSI